MQWLLKRPSVLPGFGLTLGYSVFYLSLIVLLPLSALAFQASDLAWGRFSAAVGSPRALASYRLPFGTALVAAAVNLTFGLLTAWVLERYRFFGRKWLDAMIDLPFALPTAVSGIALTAIYAPTGWIGQYLEPLGIKVAFTPIGVTVALVFIGLPFVVRTLQPAISELNRAHEEAAASLGANRWQTITRVVLPALLPAMLTGFALSFARGLGEYGSVVFISGNMPLKTEVTSLLIVTRLEQYDTAGATAIALVMLLTSFVLLFAINMLQRWSQRRFQGAEA